ncbi:aldo/keto reductase [Glaciihabitans sp. UYNi722]|uniref:aldo/keto reductase n=1 Tax=Glaciihabitans sp. UYNi722 TaxID=3156344 RepID=UPI003398C907
MQTATTRRSVSITRLGLGVAQFGNLFRETTDADATAAVDAAWAGGVRYFDTAPHYGLGLAELRLGRSLAGYPREQFTISSKVGRLLVPSPETAHRLDDEGFVVPAATRRAVDFSRDGIRRSLEATLARTGLDGIDILYLHDPEDHLEAALDTGAAALAELRDEGVITAFGVGTNFASVATRFVRETDIDLAMIAGRFTLLDQSAVGEMLPSALERGIGVVAAGVYNSGLLSSARPAPDSKYDYADAPAGHIARAIAIAEICETHGVTLPQAAIAYPLSHPAVVSVVLGARNAAQAAGNLERFDVAVPPETWARLWAELDDAGFLDYVAPQLHLDSESTITEGTP